MKKNIAFSELSIVGLVFEVVLISFVFISISYFANRSDPLFLKSELNIALILVSVITLFYGLLSGLITITLIGTALYFFYKPFPFQYFANILLFMLIFSEFNYFWNRAITKLRKQNEYLETKINTLIKNFYLLKLSHDQLEKSYILKPTSLRNVLDHIKKLYIQKPMDAYNELLTIVSKSYGIKKSAIFSYRDGSFYNEASLNSDGKLNEESKVLNDAIETKSVSYLSKFEDMKKDYLAVIPAYDRSDNLCFIMTIEEMQFLQFNKETLFSIWVILNYFSDFIHSVNSLKRDEAEKFSQCPIEFVAELKRVSHIRKKLGLKSFVVVLKFLQPPVEMEDMSNILNKNLRGLDTSCIKGNSILILFPFVSYSHIESIVVKIKNQLLDRFHLKDDSVLYKALEVDGHYQKTLEQIIEIVER